MDLISALLVINAHVQLMSISLTVPSHINTVCMHVCQLRNVLHTNHNWKLINDLIKYTFQYANLYNMQITMQISSRMILLEFLLHQICYVEDIHMKNVLFHTLLILY